MAAQLFDLDDPIPKPDDTEILYMLCYVCACMCLTHVEQVVQVVPVCLRLSSVPFLQQSASVSYAALPFLGGSATHQDPLSLTPLTLGLMRNANSPVSTPPSLTSTTSKFLGCSGKYVKHHCLLWEVLSHPLHGIRARTASRPNQGAPVTTVKTTDDTTVKTTV